MKRPFILLFVCFSVAISNEFESSKVHHISAEAKPPLNRPTEYQTEEQRLLYHLMRTYERSVRPVRNASTTITVKLGMTLTNIFDIDEKSQVLTINVWLDQEWKDELLAWEPKQFSGITSIRLPCDTIWLPDILLYNNADDFTSGYMRSRAMVFYDGTVFWPPPTRLRSLCKIDVTYFPFDDQLCILKFGSWSYHGFQLDLTNRSTNIDLTNYVESGEFELVRVHQKRRVVKYSCCDEPYPDITFYIHVRRKTLFYIHNIVFPCVMMSVLTLLVFYLPPDSGEKVGLGITVLLAFSVFVLAVAEKMPETSESLPLIGIYLTTIMFLTSISVVMTVLVLNFHHRGFMNEEVPEWIDELFLNKLRRFVRMKKRRSSILTKAAAPCNNKTSRRRPTIISMNGVNKMDYELVPNGVDKEEEHENNNHNMALSHRMPDKLNVVEQTILTSLQELLQQQRYQFQQETRAEKWRMVAEVIDRLLFHIFLVSTLLITVIMLLMIPLYRRLFYDDQFDEKLFGRM
ncbi:unnamed protein product [Bursaphelenchus xylophilus]|uniref:(pine wood nematode) hypothetical protein n=1 Tax=Bursaphelenchus xylophilus TaxID=6326 RepID=A0A7I8XGK6_BURXY|nr:unnamed protein product [Bursaphelenchus xylophilus]CAG9081809.1 unnamed protein product [Bursaphelenchus xylophilus]